MLTLSMLVLLSQAVPVGPAVPVVKPKPRLSWSDGKRSYPVFESTKQVAERLPTNTVKAGVLAADPSAQVIAQTATMRIWSVRDAAAVLGQVPSLRPVLHDIAPETGNWKVALSLVCHGEEQVMSSREVLSRSGSNGCLPNFWYPAHAQ